MAVTGTITTENSLPDKAIWVTIYEANGDIQDDYGMVDPGQTRDWFSGKYFLGSAYKVRAEVKSDSQGSDPTIYDTEIQVYCQNHNVVRLQQGTDNYYWQHT